MFAAGDDENSDWLLYSSGWLVGRVHRPGVARTEAISWSLTGPHDLLISMRGDATTIEDAKEHLIAALRAWAAWAGVRRDGADAPRWILTRDHHPRNFGPAYEEQSDWLLLSGHFVVGHVHRPLNGPRHEPHWALTAHAARAYRTARMGGQRRWRQGETVQRVVRVAAMGRAAGA